MTGPPTAHPRLNIFGIARDLLAFVLKQPRISTLVRFGAESDRDNYHARILQRLGAAVDQFGVLNIHKIAIDAPPLLVWERVVNWAHDPNCWPMCIAPVERHAGSDDYIEMFLLGRKKHLPGFPDGLFGYHFNPLFRMKIERRQDTPGALAPDNARFLLYRCVGGYPIGLFSIYVRSAIASEGERERTQFFFVVAFDFYGRPQWSRVSPIRWSWEWIHNRVTGNVLNRFKEECEAEFTELQAGI